MSEFCHTCMKGREEDTEEEGIGERGGRIRGRRRENGGRELGRMREEERDRREREEWREKNRGES